MKKLYAKLFGTLSILLITLMLTAQVDQRTVRGKVTDNTGQLLSGVSVSLKGTSLATATNDQGMYSIVVPKNTTAILLFSFIGQQVQEITLGTSNEVNVIMEPEAQALEEVVAIGYGTAKKKDLTGAVALINGDDIAKRNQTMLSQALQGAAPGVTVTRSSGLPGATATIRVRGITSIGDSNPLILVDGIPVESIDRVNPNDVESMTVLKDAASASIYGSRAAAGVVLITTKRAKANQLNLDYQALFGLVTPTQFPGVVNHVRYMEMINEVAWNDGGNLPGSEYSIYNRDFIADYAANNRLTSAEEYPIINWVDYLIKDYAPSNSHGLSLTYGNDFIKSKASLNYEKEEALYNNRSFDRISSRINNEFKITKFLTAEVGASYLRSANLQPIVNPLSSAYKYGPLETPYWSDGRVSEGRNGTNVWARLNYGGFNNSWGDELTGRIALNFKPIDNLTISAVAAPTVRSVKDKVFSKQVPYYDRENTVTSSGFVGGHESTSLSEGRSELRTMTKQLTANYNTTIANDHELSFMAGYEDYYRYAEGLNASSDKLELADFPYLDRANLALIQNGGNANENAYNSYFGRVMYSYANKYLLQANIRYDGSSRFHKDSRWASFPSLSAGWVLSEESFFKALNFEQLNFFKFRASYGTLGNERIGSYYPYQAIMNFNNALFLNDGTVTSRTTAGQGKYNIRDISWETTESYNLGFDATFFANRLSLSGDYYKKHTKDMLLGLEIPKFMGYDNPEQNAGSMHTKGWDAQIGWKDQLGDFRYAISANLSDYKSIMGNLSGLVFDGDKIIREGVEFQSWYGYRSDGLFLSQEDINQSALLSTNVKPGDVKYLDISGTAGQPDGKVSPDNDRVPLGGSLPRYTYGGTINLGYKGFDAYLMFQGVGKQTSQMSVDMVYQTAAWHTFPDFVDGNYYSEYNTPEINSTVRYPRLSQLAYEGNNFKMSDFWLFDGSYFRLKNVTVGYTLADNWSKSLKLSNVRVYASVSDLFSHDQYPKGWDPEAGLTAYIARTWNFGLQVKF